MQEMPEVTMPTLNLLPNTTAKRKHQIGYLAHDLAEREEELALKRMHSRKTKAQTQAKYGW